MKSWLSKLLAFALVAIALPTLAVAAGHKHPPKHKPFTKHSQTKPHHPKHHK